MTSLNLKVCTSVPVSQKLIKKIILVPSIEKWRIVFTLLSKKTNGSSQLWNGIVVKPSAKQLRDQMNCTSPSSPSMSCPILLTPITILQKMKRFKGLFFYRCYHVEGKPVLGEGVKDFAWVTKKELKDFLEPEVYESLERMLVDW
mmetsp:Transcript_28739/g.39770  ORF Transcript_28739/g.39770 Transcript_28739/m.39770 type:complete len:145 (+) Transcript_28739:411-845(+)